MSVYIRGEIEFSSINVLASRRCPFIENGQYRKRGYNDNMRPLSHCLRVDFIVNVMTHIHPLPVFIDALSMYKKQQCTSFAVYSTHNNDNSVKVFLFGTVHRIILSLALL
jgi:hypothetical protein